MFSSRPMVSMSATEGGSGGAGEGVQLFSCRYVVSETLLVKLCCLVLSTRTL